MGRKNPRVREAEDDAWVAVEAQCVCCTKTCMCPGSRNVTVEVGGVELSIEAYLCRPCYTSLWRAAKRDNSRFFRKEDYNSNWSDAAKMELIRGKQEQDVEFNAMLANIARARVKSGEVWLQCKPIH